jgi:uncharacterized protein (DUF1800 family)
MPNRSSNLLRQPGRILLTLGVSALLALLGGCQEEAPDALRPQGGALAPVTDAEGARFLAQATFGGRPEDLTRLKSAGLDAWITAQMDAPVARTHLAMVEQSAASQGRSPQTQDVQQSWWTAALTDHSAQLRHRVAFALSQIFVVSTVSVSNPRTVASYMDTLTQHAGGRYRDLLEAVVLHPAMGQYLSHLGNRKEDNNGRVPDENLAREVMQLFSIGLVQLDEAGQPVRVNHQVAETYTAADIKGLARVFTGFSWARVRTTSDWTDCFTRTPACRDDSQDVLPMAAYPQAHATTEKAFLGVRVPAQSTADPTGSLKVALDRLATHPNTAPFISRQLIQRLVSSNPSNRYVQDVSRVFVKTGGNLREVVRAILMHAEARDPASAAPNPTHAGRVREPLLRMTHLMRALPHQSLKYTQHSVYGATDTHDMASGLAQSPLRAPSVFNFYRPGYRLPQSGSGDAGLVAPELQIASESAVLGYANFVASALEYGWGDWHDKARQRDMVFQLQGWLPLAGNPEQLLDSLARRVLGAPLPAEARGTALAGLQTMPSDTEAQKLARVRAAALLIAVSPQFTVEQ